MTRGIHDGVHEPVVPPREVGEDVTAWMRRIALANGWRTEPEPEEKEPGSDG